jgi:hypothetical protein
MAFSSRTPMVREGPSRWRPDGTELFYLGPPDGTPTMMAVPVDVRSGFVSGDAAKLFAGTYFTALNGRTYDVSADGRRFLMVKAASTSPRGGLPRAVIVENWFSELDRLVPIS